MIENNNYDAKRNIFIKKMGFMLGICQILPDLTFNFISMPTKNGFKNAIQIKSLSTDENFLWNLRKEDMSDNLANLEYNLMNYLNDQKILKINPATENFESFCEKTIHTFRNVDAFEEESNKIAIANLVSSWKIKNFYNDIVSLNRLNETETKTIASANFLSSLIFAFPEEVLSDSEIINALLNCQDYLFKESVMVSKSLLNDVPLTPLSISVPKFDTAYFNMLYKNFINFTNSQAGSNLSEREFNEIGMKSEQLEYMISKNFPNQPEKWHLAKNLVTSREFINVYNELLFLNENFDSKNIEELYNLKILELKNLVNNEIDSDTNTFISFLHFINNNEFSSLINDINSIKFAEDDNCLIDFPEFDSDDEFQKYEGFDSDINEI